MTPSPLSPPPIPTPDPLLETKPDRPDSAEEEEEEVEAAEEEEEGMVLAAEEVGSVRDGAASDGFKSVVKQGPNRFLQFPFFFFFTPSSAAPAAAPPSPSPELEGCGRL